MGLTLRDPSQEDFNQLKKMLNDGTINPQQLHDADVSYTGPPQQIDDASQNMLTWMMRGQDSPQIQPMEPKPRGIRVNSQAPDDVLPMLQRIVQQSTPNSLADMMQGDPNGKITQSQEAMAQASANQASASQAQSPEVRQGGGYMQMDNGPRQSIGAQNDPSPQQISDQASTAKNADGVTLSKLTPGDGYQGIKSGQGIIRMTQPDGTTEDRYINDGAGQGAQGPSVPMKLYGYGDGTLSSLGNASPDSSASTDISRNPVNVPGLGTGYYSKDGRSAIITNSDGSKSQVLLGYDRAGSLAIDAANMQRQKTQGDITHTAAETDLVNAKVADYAKPDAAAANAAVSLSEVVDPKDPSRMLRVDARAYKGGTLGDVGVIGVSGKEPTLGKAEDKKTEGREGLKLDIQAMRDGYQKLDDLKAIPNIDNTPYENFKASAASSDFGQAIGNKLGTNEQEIRNEIDASKRRLLSSIKAATNAGSREFGTNYEMKLWMDSMGNTQRPVGGNLDILNEFEKKYITGPEAREAAKKALNNPANANSSSPPNVTDPSNSSSNMPPPLIRSADTSASIRNAQAAINSGKWTRAQAIEKLRSAGIMDTP